MALAQGKRVAKAPEPKYQKGDQVVLAVNRWGPFVAGTTCRVVAVIAKSLNGIRYCVAAADGRVDWVGEAELAGRQLELGFGAAAAPEP